jgi:hypothetical protein
MRDREVQAVSPDVHCHSRMPLEMIRGRLFAGCSIGHRQIDVLRATSRTSFVVKTGDVGGAAGAIAIHLEHFGGFAGRGVRADGVEVEGLTVRFDIRGGILQRTVRRVHAGGEQQFSLATR